MELRTQHVEGRFILQKRLNERSVVAPLYGRLPKDIALCQQPARLGERVGCYPRGRGLCFFQLGLSDDVGDSSHQFPRALAGLCVSALLVRRGTEALDEGDGSQSILLPSETRVFAEDVIEVDPNITPGVAASGRGCVVRGVRMTSATARHYEQSNDRQQVVRRAEHG
jgi:hypothetical protein